MTGATAVSEELMGLAVGARHGVVPSADVLQTTFADVPGVWHASVPSSGRGGWTGASGGVGWSRAGAVAAAVGEALERYAAGGYPLPEEPCSNLGSEKVLPLDAFTLFDDRQIADPGFPYGGVWARHASGRGTYGDAYAVGDGARWWVPRFLLGLGDVTGHGLSTSSGLAAGPSRIRALLRATQELIERDALMVTWDRSLPGRRVCLAPRYRDPVSALGGTVVAVDATPAWSPHRVAVVCGWVPLRGMRRIALGAACRATWAEAFDKAFLEWCQGVLFAGVVRMSDPRRRYRRAADVRTFEDHAAYYTFHPDHWRRVPLLRGELVAAPEPLEPASGGRADDRAQLLHLTGALAEAGVRLLCRDLTTCDLAQVGVYAVRVLSPDLVPIWCEHGWPYRGGRSGDVTWRYPWAGTASSPNPWPHPLG
jgi:ribosomal protein S12 methylthiotransferase accessory factor